jgi:hypothetical protein
MSRRRGVALGAFGTVLAVSGGLVVADRAGDDAGGSTATEARAPATIVMVDPPVFSKEILLGPGHPPTTAPTTTTAAPPTTPAPAPTTAAPPPTVAAPATEAPPAPAASGLRCIVRLHGKGGGAGGTHSVAADLVEVAPGGNGSAWGGRVWNYFPESGYVAARSSVVAAVDAAGCGRIVVVGFSNGGAFAAKLFCRGESFDGRLIGVIVDDPVVDHAVDGCRAARGVRVALYWTGALASTATPGWNCAEQDWTCEGGTTIGIDAYQRALGVTRQQSPHTTHAVYQSPPELSSWW